MFPSDFPLLSPAQWLFETHQDSPAVSCSYHAITEYEGDIKHCFVEGSWALLRGVDFLFRYWSSDEIWLVKCLNFRLVCKFLSDLFAHDMSLKSFVKYSQFILFKWEWIDALVFTDTELQYLMGGYDEVVPKKKGLLIEFASKTGFRPGILSSETRSESGGEKFWLKTCFTQEMRAKTRTHHFASNLDLWSGQRQKLPKDRKTPLKLFSVSVARHVMNQTFSWHARVENAPNEPRFECAS